MKVGGVELTIIVQPRQNDKTAIISNGMRQQQAVNSAGKSSTLERNPRLITQPGYLSYRNINSPGDTLRFINYHHMETRWGWA